MGQKLERDVTSSKNFDMVIIIIIVVRSKVPDYDRSCILYKGDF